MAIAPAETTELDVSGVIDALKTKYEGAVTEDSREGFEGILVDKDKLVDVAMTIRDEMGYDYLSSATAVDYLGISDDMEMVYHAYRTSGGPALVFKSKTDRDESEIPSLIDVWPGVDLQEREAYDLFGIKFLGHPNLKRILLWDGFSGHPMRKDWKEAYYEQDHKPFDSRWPEGYVHRAEEKNIFGKNVHYPDDFDLGKLSDTSESSLYSGLGLGVDVQELDSGGLKTDRLVVNLGPHHPSTHGVWMNGVPLPADARSVAVELQRAGYRTALIGKPHFEPFVDPHHAWYRKSPDVCIQQADAKAVSG